MVSAAHSNAPRIAVVALQGDFEQHILRAAQLGADAYGARQPGEIDSADGIILPGGESTTIGKLLSRYGVETAILNAHGRGVPIYGTCAGMILLSHAIEKSTAERGAQRTLDLIDIDVARNAYGSQIDSFEAVLTDSLLFGTERDGADLEAVFIRAPRITRCGDAVHVLARFSGDPVLVRQETVLASTFHPEVTADCRVHDYFLNMVAQRKAR